MLPRAIGRRVGIRSRPLSTNKNCAYRGNDAAVCQSIASLPYTTNSTGCRQQRHTAGEEKAAPVAVAPAGRRWQHQRHFSVGTRAVATAAPSSEFERDEAEQQDKPFKPFGTEIERSGSGEEDRFPPSPPAEGLRPETAPASTPLDLGCKAYYMARNIGIKAICTVRSLSVVLATSTAALKHGFVRGLLLPPSPSLFSHPLGIQPVNLNVILSNLLWEVHSYQHPACLLLLGTKPTGFSAQRTRATHSRQSRYTT